MARIGIAGFLHESNTYVEPQTPVEHFVSTSWTTGAALVERWRGARHEIGGMLDGVERSGAEVVPLFATYAMPSGTIVPEAFEQIASSLLRAMRDAGPLDGLLLALHGATVSADYPDADGEVLSRVRAAAGPVPLVVTFDLHANVSEQMISLCDAAIAYRSNPHLDQYERGLEAAALLARMLREGLRPAQALETPPLVIPISAQDTTKGPASALYRDLEEVLRRPDILSASVAMGFYYADVAEMGAAFWAVSSNGEAAAREAARWMAQRAWERRESFVTALPDAAEAVARAAASVEKPVVLMDIGDNVGGGGPGDSTVLLHEVLRQTAREALVILADPESATACARAGVRQHVRLRAGGKSGALHGAPVEVEGVVRTLSDGIFVETQVRHGGWGGGDQGLTAVVETAEGHTVVLTSRRMAPMSLEQLYSAGIRPERKRLLIVKGAVAPRAAYEPIASEVIAVDTPGVTADNPLRFPYRNRRTPMFPFERGLRWDPAPLTR